MERKIHLINWEVVCTQKENGRLVIGMKYGQEGFGWRTNEARGAFRVGVWKEILKEANWCWDNIMFKLFALAVHRNATINEGLQDLLRRGLDGLERYGSRHLWSQMLAVPNTLAFPVRCIWVDKVPTKAALFAWEAMWGKILTLDRLKK
ncbi:hypothetical protein CK203_038796 [Vitis vinifera]|uniref:Reverse transcriptase zinc-binding domain-containing protein n=1 Tax=Vitis vinifera TaxID=29760 RepID=A0A438I1M7_VITVI|nr:hypothetical protein CK203_038796 [Vitis vinifera]